MSKQALQYRATSDSVTLYWEKPSEADPDALYTVLLDGVFAGETDRTHFSLKGLEPAASQKSNDQTTQYGFS